MMTGEWIMTIVRRNFGKLVLSLAAAALMAAPVFAQSAATPRA